MMEELPGQHTEQDKTFQNTAECGGYLKFHLEIFHAYFQARKKEKKAMEEMRNRESQATTMAV